MCTENKIMDLSNPAYLKREYWEKKWTEHIKLLQRRFGPCLFAFTKAKKELKQQLLAKFTTLEVDTPAIVNMIVEVVVDDGGTMPMHPHQNYIGVITFLEHYGKNGQDRLRDALLDRLRVALE